ncbi:hypothetical protein JRQ81_000013 [Phrynocephalus forsythii]|uniref:Ubiquitin-like protease family profile domain-containing protein n=1 Tax=Phrynocephalus forsythii TaxID=171643 RepID=A0A9Q0X8D0_9SAUR|nr:hypothetical protein JRQ81_000013 [Phrynocephalus forsythii]
MKMRYGNDCISAPWHGCTFSKLDKIDQGLLGSVANICIYDYDIETLEGHNWLNDHIIDGFLASRAIMAKELGHDGTVFPPSCYFFENLVSGRLSPGVYKYFLKYGVLRKDVLLIPVNDSKVHWILIVVVFKRKTTLYLDSNHGLKLSILKVITSFFGQLYEQISKKPYTFKDWSFFAPNDVPKQDNSSDCGPFVCAFSHLIASGNKHQFTQKDMCSIRPWIAKEILGYRGKSYLEKEENYIPLEIGDDYCSDILPSLFEGRCSQCFLKDNCRRPIEDVTKVFCDGTCKDWYHCCCLGIDPKDLPSVFICQRCKSESDK